jgi:hypothetical protein
VLPHKAEELRQLDRAMLILTDYWSKQPRGTGYLNRYTVGSWLKHCTVDEIKTVMGVAAGYWADLRTEMERIVDARKQAQADSLAR